MKQYVVCPVCNAVMLTEFGSQFNPCTIKRCVRSPSHNIETFSADIYDEIYKIRILVKNETAIWAVWDFTAKQLEVGNAVLSQMLPWFEPDITNYRKLTDKIMTYLIFS